MSPNEQNSAHQTLPARKIGLLAFGVATFLFFYQQTIENSYAPLRAEFAQDLGLSTLQTAFISTSFLIAFAIAQIPSGLLLDRFGPARLLPVVAITTGFAAALHLFALFMGAADMVIGLGGVTGIWGANELQAATNWRVALQIAAIVALPTALMLYFYVPQKWFGAGANSKSHGRKTSAMDSIKDLLARADVRVACMIYAGACGTMCGFGGMWNMQLAESWEWKEAQAVLIATSFFVGIAIGSPITGWIGGKFGSRVTVLVCMWVTLIGFLFWLLVPSDWPLWFDAMNVGLIGAGLSSMVLAFEIAGRSLPPERVASAIALVNLAGILAGVLLELIPGFISQLMNAPPLREMQLANGVFAVVLVFTIWVTRKVDPR